MGNFHTHIVTAVSTFVIFVTGMVTKVICQILPFVKDGIDILAGLIGLIGGITWYMTLLIKRKNAIIDNVVKREEQKQRHKRKIITKRAYSGYHALLTRSKMSTDQYTIGDFILYLDGKEVFRCKSLELPWKDNKRNISCVVTGLYVVQKIRDRRYSVEVVPNRSLIRIHFGSFTTNIKGCILLGDKHTDINKDGVIDIVGTKATLKKLQEITEKFTLEIKWEEDEKDN